MAAAFSPSIVMSAFEDNGQIDRLEGVIPSIEAMVRTYRGTIPDDHYLKDTDHIVRKYYDEVFRTGRISESSFDDEDVTVDYDSGGKEVNRRFGISKENCQRAKVLSAKTQRLERIELIKEMAKMEVRKQVDLFLYEKKNTT